MSIGLETLPKTGYFVLLYVVSEIILLEVGFLVFGFGAIFSGNVVDSTSYVVSNSVATMGALVGPVYVFSGGYV